MTKRIKKNKKCKSSLIDEQYIESYKNLKKTSKNDNVPFKYDILGNQFGRKLNLVETKKSVHYKKKNSPEVVKIKRLRKKIALNDKMAIDSYPSKEHEAFDIWDVSIQKKKEKKFNLKNINQLIPAVEFPHPGQSYNPDPEDYKSLVDQAVHIIDSSNNEDTVKGIQEIDEMINKHIPLLDLSNLDLKKKQLILNIINKDPENLDSDEIDKILNEECEEYIGDKEDRDQDDKKNKEREGKRKHRNNRNNNLDMNEVDMISYSKKGPRRKTKTERNKLKVLKEEKRKKIVIKSIKKMKNDINHIKKLNTFKPSNKSIDRLIRFKKYIGKLISGEVPSKISNKTFYMDPPEINLPEEINASVKNIEGTNESPIIRVFKSIYRRGLLPPPPKLNYRYKNIIRKLKNYNRNYIYKTVLSN